MSMMESEYEREEFLEKFVEEELRQIAEGPVFQYLATYGDAIEARVRGCLSEARRLSDAEFYGAALVRAAAGIEVTIRFFLAKPLLQGAFLSEEWEQLLSEKIFNKRTAEDRKLLPAILRNWKIDVTQIKLKDGRQTWEQIVAKVWPLRNDYVHKATDALPEDATCAIQCLESLLSEIVDPLGQRLGFTRELSGRWSVVVIENPPDLPGLNPPRSYEPKSPFEG